MDHENPKLSLSNGRYRIDRLIGEGGMAAVFLATDMELQVQRAIKVLHPELVVHASQRKRFETEALSMAKLDHPQILHIYDYGTEGLSKFIVLEAAQGSIQGYVQHYGALTIGQGLKIVRAMASALRAAHHKDIVHRDIKPDNILLTQNGPKLADFGIAHLQSAGNQTRTQAVMGTYAYMAPEQRMSAKTTGAPADIYALGLTLAVLLVQRPPVDLFLESEQAAMLEGLPSDIQAFICECCAQDPLTRPNAEEVLQRTQQLIEQYPQAEEFKAVPSHEDANNLQQLAILWSKYVSTQETMAEFGMETAVLPFDEREAQKEISNIQSAALPADKNPTHRIKPWGGFALGFLCGVGATLCYFWMPSFKARAVNPSALSEVPLSIEPAAYQFYASDDGLVIAISKSRETEPRILAGEGQNIYAQRYIGGSGSGIGQSYTFWDSRLGSNSQSSLLQSEAHVTLRCGEERLELRMIDPPQARYFSPLWQRYIVFIGRSNKGQYFYIDDDRSNEGTDYRFYLGSKEQFYIQTDAVINVDFQGIVVQTEEGAFFKEGSAYAWEAGGEKITVLELEPNIEAEWIYTSPAIYPEQRLGTPCDRFFIP